MKFYNLNYKMVIRHHLLLAGEDNKKPATAPTVNSNTASPTPTKAATTTSAPASNTTPTSASKIEPNNTVSKTSTPPSPVPTSNSNIGNTNSKATTSPPPPPPHITSPTVPSKASPTTPVSNTTSPSKTGSPPPASKTNSTSPSNSTKPLTAVPVSSASSNKQLSIDPSSKPVNSTSKINSTSPTSNTSGYFLGMSTTVLIQLGIVLIIIAIIITVIVILYKRHQTRKEYNDSPENFAHKPDLSFTEDYNLGHTKLQACFNENRVVITPQEQLAGKIFQVEFKGTQKSAVLYHRRQKNTAYFEIEVTQANGPVQIGFIPIVSRQKFKRGEESISTAGVGVNNTGFVQAEGENIFNYSWTLAFGDVFGIGITPQNAKFSERRAWISKNGVLLNFPPNDEMDKWLATINIASEQKNAYNLGTEQKEKQQGAEDKLDEKEIKDKAARQKNETLLKKQRISLKIFNQFSFYPAIVCHGNKKDSDVTKINVNVGGQVFRMCDTQFRSGLLG